jgi:UDP-N-acetylglucosamine 2-epimerase
MIHVVIGTKAQYIKTAPLLQELDRRGIDYNLIDSGQHGQLTPKYREFFGIKAPDTKLVSRDQDIKDLRSGLVWLFKLLWRALVKPEEIRQKVFRNEGGVCIIHGDTSTTLVSLILAKRCHIKVLHLESGLRSFNLLNPFPEELIRVITMRFADYLFPSSEWSLKNLQEMQLKGRIFPVSQNTVLDALRFALSKAEDQRVSQYPYIVVTIHRLETIFSSKKMTYIVNLLRRLSSTFRVYFPIHKPTEAKLQQYGLTDILSDNRNIVQHELFEYPEFIKILQNATFVITDGGSIQEECYYLGLPCLILREKTERVEGLGENALLSEFNENKIEDFLRDFINYRRPAKVYEESYPSREIVDFLLPEMNMLGFKIPYKDKKSAE